MNFKEVCRCKKYLEERNNRAQWLIVSGETNVSEFFYFKSSSNELLFTVSGNIERGADVDNLEISLKCPCEGWVGINRKTWAGLGNQPKQTQLAFPDLVNPYYKLYNNNRTQKHGSSIEQLMSHHQIISSPRVLMMNTGKMGHQWNHQHLKSTLFLHCAIISL